MPRRCGVATSLETEVPALSWLDQFPTPGPRLNWRSRSSSGAEDVTWLKNNASASSTRLMACSARRRPSRVTLKCPQRTGGLLSVEPKSDKGKRTIGIPSQLVVALRAHRQAQREERMAAGSLWQDHGLVSSSPAGGKVDPRTDWAEWKAILQAAGVLDARLHDARHTAATLLLEQNVDARVVMEILRHSADLADAGYLPARPAEAHHRRHRAGRRRALFAGCNHRCTIHERLIFPCYQRSC